MEAHSQLQPVAAPLLRGPFIAWQALAWCLAALLLGAAVARAAVWIERVRAPLVLFPLLVGCALGLALAGLMRLANFGHRPTLLAGAALAAAAAIFFQHYFSYRDYVDARAAFLAQKNQNAALDAFREMLPDTPSFAGYMRQQAAVGRPLMELKSGTLSLRGAAAWASWTVDALLVLAAAVTIVYVFSRGPYCPLCGSWYRSVRRGVAHGEAVGKMAQAGRISDAESIAVARYRLSHCASGCGPAHLELAWEDSQLRSRHVEAWLSPAEREQVARALDEMN